MQTRQVDERGIVERFEKRTPRSRETFRRAIGVTPGGVMAGIKFFEPYPLFMERARGSRVWDIDGNEYVDYLMSYGALILGHGHPVVKEAMESVLRTTGTTVLGTPSEKEIEYGMILRDTYHKDGKIRLTNSGLESTLLAVRLARAHTGRRKVAKFEGHYHGAVESLLFSYAPDPDRAGSPASPTAISDSAELDSRDLSDSLVLPFNDWESTERLLSKHSSELACVIMEPFEEGVIPGERRFMEGLRRLTADLGIPLIYDEVKTGFRVRVGGASEYYSIVPDLTCLGKIIGGGLPIGALVGDSEIMGQLDPRSSGRRVFHSGTFNGNPLSISAGKATVDQLKRRGRFETVQEQTLALRRAMEASLTRHRLPHRVLGEGAMFNIYITDWEVRNYRDVKKSDLTFRRNLDIELITRGVYLKPENRYCLSTAHSEDDIKLTAKVFEESLDVLVPASSR